MKHRDTKGERMFGAILCGVVITLANILCLYALLTFISPIIMFTMEEEFLRDQLKNQYVDNDFLGWHEEIIGGIGTVKMPDAWMLENVDRGYRIIDTDGTVIAYGAVLGVQDAPYSNLEEFMNEILGYYPERMDFHADSQFISIQRSEFGSVSVQSGNEITRANYMKIFDGIKPYTIMVFTNEQGLSYSEVLEVSQAISFSRLVTDQD